MGRRGTMSMILVSLSTETGGHQIVGVAETLPLAEEMVRRKRMACRGGMFHLQEVEVFREACLPFDWKEAYLKMADLAFDAIELARDYSGNDSENAHEMGRRYLAIEKGVPS